MTAKEQKIKEYYGEDYNKILSSDYGIDENGFSDFYAHGNETYLQAHEVFSGKSPDDIIRVRPLGLGKQLELLETNNGWIKIESENDLPSENGIYWVSYENDIYDEPRTKEEIILDYKKESDFFTHYQPIIKPEPPIY